MSNATIISQSTPSGLSAIAVIRLSGSNAINISKKVSKNYHSFKHRVAEVRYVYSGIDLIDQAVFTAFLSPNSYTGEDVVEISCHGNVHICEATINEFIKFGARIAKPGEYTKRAFLNGKLNLLQAESVIQLINAKSIEAVKQQTKNLSGGISAKIRELKASLVSNLAYLEYELDVSEDVYIDEEGLGRIKKALKVNLETANLMVNTFNRGNALSNGTRAGVNAPPLPSQPPPTIEQQQQAPAVVQPAPQVMQQAPAMQPMMTPFNQQLTMEMEPLL